MGHPSGTLHPSPLAAPHLWARGHCKQLMRVKREALPLGLILIQVVCPCGARLKSFDKGDAAVYTGDALYMPEHTFMHKKYFHHGQ